MIRYYSFKFSTIFETSSKSSKVSISAQRLFLKSKPYISHLSETTLKAYNLDMLREAINSSHCGWKGGSFEYDFDTNIHFECDYGSWTGGKYLENFLQRNGEEPVVKHIFNEEI
jgi:hypothetical protein